MFFNLNDTLVMDWLIFFYGSSNLCRLFKAKLQFRLSVLAFITRYSQEDSHLNTEYAQHCLTSSIEWKLLFSVWFHCKPLFTDMWLLIISGEHSTLALGFNLGSLPVSISVTTAKYKYTYIYNSTYISAINLSLSKFCCIIE